MSNPFWVVAVAVIFFVQENNYFGWNMKPQSDAELIADGIVMLLLGMAFAVRK